MITIAGFPVDLQGHRHGGIAWLAYLSPLTSRRLPRLLNRMANHGPGITFALMIRTWAYTFPSALAFDAADNTL